MAVLGQCLSLGPMLVYTLGVFAKPLTTEFKTSRGAISLALTLTNLMSAVAAPGAGWLVDRLGARRVITCSILAFTACLLALSRVTTSFGHFDVLYAMAGVLAVGATPVTYSRVLATRGCKLQSARRPSHLSTRFRSAWIDCNGTSSRCGNRAAPVLPGTTRDATKRPKLLGHIHVFQKVLLRGLHTACTAHTEPQLRALR